jgi:CDGSH-type Zn-finger protein
MVFDATDKVNFEFLFQIGIRGRELDNFMGVGCMAFDQDGNLVVSDSYNRRIKVIKIHNIDQPARRSFPVVKVISHELLEYPASIALSRDACPTLVVEGKQKTSSTCGSSLFLFEYDSGNLLRVLNCEPEYRHSIAITSDGQLAVCHCGTNNIKFFEFCDGDPKIVSETSSCMLKSDKGVPSAGGGIAAMHNPPKKTSLPKINSLAHYVMSHHAIPENIRKELLDLRNHDYSSSSSSDSERVYPSSSGSDSPSSSSDSD